MEYKLFSRKSPKLENTINIIVEYKEDNEQYHNLLKYIASYREQTKILVKKDNEKVFINKEDILFYFSNKQHNYCQTKEGTFRIMSRLYKIEEDNPDYIRISKSHIINAKKILKFDMATSTKIVIVMEDGSKLLASRRRVRNVYDFLDERSI